jgi:predicted DNA-binding transcriptional regulator AlpA
MTVDTEGEELIDAREVAERLGLKNPRTVLDLRIHRLGFPAPVGRQGRTLLWSWAQVELWGATAASLDFTAGEARVTVR